jgi:hemerythrin-like domain-containing protein
MVETRRSMQLIEELRAEHELIEQVVGSLRAFVNERCAGRGDAADGPRFMRFFRLYAGHFHHAREEDTLFVALQREAELPGDRGPIAVLLADHDRMAALLDGMEGLIGGPLDDDAARQRLQGLAVEYSRALWRHIDAENSVLFPESRERLRRHGIRELPSRDMTDEERDARTIGHELVLRYPPLVDPELIRGDGCVMCPAFVENCRGLEREWWTESEWDEFEDHLPAG